MSEDIDIGENFVEVKRRGRPRKNIEEDKKETKTVKKETKKQEDTKQKRRGRPKKNIEEVIEKEEKKDTKKAIEKKETNKKNTNTKIKKEIKKDDKLLVKNKLEDLSINDEKLEKIQQEINKQKTISTEKRKKIDKKIFINVVVAISIILYFIFINLGYANLELKKYLIDLKVFSIVTIGITILLFEKSYKKDSGEITIFGIETLILSIITLLTSYYCVVYSNKYPYIINCIAILFGLYYVVKSTIIYLKMKKKALYTSGDIHKIVKK